MIGGGLGAVVHGEGGRYRKDEGDGEAGLWARGFQPRGPFPYGGGCCPDIFAADGSDDRDLWVWFYFEFTFGVAIVSQRLLDGVVGFNLTYYTGEGIIKKYFKLRSILNFKFFKWFIICPSFFRFH